MHHIGDLDSSIDTGKKKEKQIHMITTVRDKFKKQTKGGRGHKSATVSS